jgi:hypothetical protein
VIAFEMRWPGIDCSEECSRTKKQRAIVAVPKLNRKAAAQLREALVRRSLWEQEQNLITEDTGQIALLKKL